MKTKMKTKIFLPVLTIAIAFVGCTKDSPSPETVISTTITELDASDYLINFTDTSLSGEFVRFSFADSTVVTGDNNNWDVAFRGTTIIVNGGESSNVDQPDRTGNSAVYIADGTMQSVAEVDATLLAKDNTTSPAIIDDFGFTGNGWCNYSGPPHHIVSPIAGIILVFRTHNNKYAKMEVLNFYDTPMTKPFGGFYTFNYVYQSDGGTTF